MNDRPGWDEYFLRLAQAVALRADCRRRKVGAVLVKGRRVVSTGYNGAAAGKSSCLAGDCPRGLLSYADCQAFGSYANCIAVHAEANALLYANHAETVNGTMYITCEPCADCLKLLDGALVAEVIYGDPEGEVSRIDL